MDKDDAINKGVNACIDAIGRDFCRSNKEYGCWGYGQDGDVMSCFYGVDKRVDNLNLDETSFQYRACADVNLKTGAVEITECVPYKENV